MLGRNCIYQLWGIVFINYGGGGTNILLSLNQMSIVRFKRLGVVMLFMATFAQRCYSDFIRL